MCGIAALLRKSDAAQSPPDLNALTNAVAHRGPDGAGHLYLDDALEESAAGGPWKVALGHRRLSIIDLSEGGRQPMRRGKLWVTYNGELYNYVELRDELKGLGVTFASSSDTEVILAAYERWGPKCFERFRGMWGLVLIDVARHELLACRDRLGIKPLYVDDGPTVAFVSELKQLLQVRPRLDADEEVLRGYLATGYEQAGRTFFRQPRVVAPGTCERWSIETGRLIETVSYWSPETIEPTIDDPDEAAALFAAELRRSVKEHLRADVPVGCALSGGLDSSAVAVLIHETAPVTLKAFTATFPGSTIDERQWVEQVLPVAGASPHWVEPTAEGFAAELDRFVWIHDEPVGSLSQYAGWCVSRRTREAGVPVTLNGQGGDEVLSSYWQSYMMHLYRLARGLHWLALFGQVAGAGVAGNGELLRQIPVMGRRFVSRRSSARDTASGALLAGVLGMTEQQRRVFEIRQMYLPRLLKWDDRNFMAFSVEGRYPFLDHRLIELCLSFTPRALYRRGWMKEPLRRGLEGVVPNAILRRKTKLGFETPQLDWLMGPLRGQLQTFVDGDSPIWRFADRNRVRKLFSSLGASAGEEAAQELFRAFIADRWMRVFNL